MILAEIEGNNMDIKKILKKEKGIIVSDAIIAILIILLFVGIITTLIVNIILETTKIKINSGQLDFATEILEYIEELPYEAVTEENLINYINNKNSEQVSAGTSTAWLTTTYKIGINVQNYNQTAGNEGKLDIIKLVTLTIENNLENKKYSTEITKIKKANMQEVEQILE